MQSENEKRQHNEYAALKIKHLTTVQDRRAIVKHHMDKQEKAYQNIFGKNKT